MNHNSQPITMAESSSARSEKEDDRLRSIHDDLQQQQQQQQQSPWLPLESNPEIFTSFCAQLGNIEGWQFVDVLGFDEESLAQIPQPVAALIFLFPCTDKIYQFRAHEKQQLLLLSSSDNSSSSSSSRAGPLLSNSTVIHIEQVSSFGNACGTIAAIHALLNAGFANSGSATTTSSSPLAEFRDSTLHLKTARERGALLVSSNIVHSLSDAAASDTTRAQTQCPSRGDTYLGHHYCSFVPISAAGGVQMVVELDGTKVSPVDHGPIPSGLSFLQAAVAVMQERWINLEPNRIDFSLMALVQTE